MHGPYLRSVRFFSFRYRGMQTIALVEVGVVPPFPTKDLGTLRLSIGAAEIIHTSVRHALSLLWSAALRVQCVYVIIVDVGWHVQAFCHNSGGVSPGFHVL